ncbi:MAG: NAD(P)-binding domain-containing protein [Trueperaceae bacterium]|nr:NAD(P)-binding domain-containing protein [Trueperaceae bacterium]
MADGKQNILIISDSLHDLPDAVRVLRESGHRLSFIHSLKRWQDITADEMPFPIAETDAIVMGRVMTVTEEALCLTPKLKVIALHTSGSDNVDMTAATQRGVLVTNVKGINAEQCADFALGLMLASVRNIVKGDKAIRTGKWVSETDSSTDIWRATLGLIGLGEIGRAVIRRAAAFDMRLLVHTRTPDENYARNYGIRYLSKDELLEQADIVVLTASLNPTTRHMMDESAFKRMKKTAHFINIARGELVDEQILYKALKEKWIAGAGIDVFETEPLFQSPLFDLANLVVTPHQAGLTESGKIGAAVRAAKNALAVLEGEIPKDSLNPQARREAV